MKSLISNIKSINRNKQYENQKTKEKIKYLK